MSLVSTEPIILHEMGFFLLTFTYMEFYLTFHAQSLFSRSPHILLHCVFSSLLSEWLHIFCKSFHVLLTFSLVPPLPSHFSSTGLVMVLHRLLGLLSIAIIDISLPSLASYLIDYLCLTQQLFGF